MDAERTRRVSGSAGSGSILVLVLFVLAISAALITGMLQLTTEELQQMRNQIGLTRALAVAEAGLHDALAQIRQDSSWNSGFSDKPFFEDSYSVTVSGSPPTMTLTSTGAVSTGYKARLEAHILAAPQSPHEITIEAIRINPE